MYYSAKDGYNTLLHYVLNYCLAQYTIIMTLYSVQDLLRVILEYPALILSYLHPVDVAGYVQLH